MLNFGIVMIKSLKTLRMTRLTWRRWVLLWAQPELGGGTLFARFCNYIFASSVLARSCKCKMHVLSQEFANILLQKYLGFASFHKYDLAGFRKLLHTFANIALVLHCFTTSSKVLQIV